MDDAPDRGEDFVASGMSVLGIEADETDLAVLAGIHKVFGPAVLQLIELDAGSVVAERNLDLSQAPPTEGGAG
jgi:hypothetical protein